MAVQKLDKILNSERLDALVFPVKDDDVIMIRLDLEQWDIDSAQQYLNIIQELFPKNKIGLLPKGTEILIYKQEEGKICHY